MAMGDLAAAEAGYREAIAIAQRRSAKLWELRAAKKKTAPGDGATPVSVRCRVKPTLARCRLRRRPISAAPTTQPNFADAYISPVGLEPVDGRITRSGPQSGRLSKRSKTRPAPRWIKAKTRSRTRIMSREHAVQEGSVSILGHGRGIGPDRSTASSRRYD